MSKSKPKTEIIEVSTKLNTLDDVLKHCNISKDSWNVDQFVVEQRAPAKDGSPQFNYKIYLQKKLDGLDTQNLFLDAINKARPSWKNVKRITAKDEYLYVLGIPDLHIGRMSWGKETGQKDYDSKIAYERQIEAVKHFMETTPLPTEAKKSMRILFPVGNDFFHTDNSNDTTTRGTKVDTDTRWQKMFLTGSQLMVDTIANIAKNHKIDVLMVPGNHDNQRTFYLGEYLKAWFKDHPNVTIENSPQTRKYYAFGKNLFGFTHGDEEKHSDLPVLMAQEASKHWSSVENKIWMIGHFHTEILKEFAGIKVYALPSLCEPDAWHATKGYTSNDRSAIAFLYGAKQGLISNHYFKIND